MAFGFTLPNHYATQSDVVHDHAVRQVVDVKALLVIEIFSSVDSKHCRDGRSGSDDQFLNVIRCRRCVGSGFAVFSLAWRLIGIQEDDELWLVGELDLAERTGLFRNGLAVNGGRRGDFYVRPRFFGRSLFFGVQRSA